MFEEKFKFIVKPPSKKEYQRETFLFKKEFNIDEEFTEKNGPRSASELVKKAILQGFKRIIFIGGDGTINQGINGIMQFGKRKILEEVTVGIIPMGTGNDFSRGLGIPKDIKGAFEVIKCNKTVSVDIGRIDDRYFVNVASFGFDAKVTSLVNSFREKCQFFPSKLSYLFIALREVFTKFCFYDIGIEAENMHLRDKMVLLAITNTPTYGAIFKINPGADFRDGVFDVCWINNLSKIKVLWYIPKVIAGKHINLPEVKTLKTSSLKVFSSHPLICEVDGEVLNPRKEYKIEVLPRAINFLVP